MIFYIVTTLNCWKSPSVINNEIFTIHLIGLYCNEKLDLVAVFSQEPIGFSIPGRCLGGKRNSSRAGIDKKGRSAETRVQQHDESFKGFVYLLGTDWFFPREGKR